MMARLTALRRMGATGAIGYGLSRLCQTLRLPIRVHHYRFFDQPLAQIPKRSGPQPQALTAPDPALGAVGVSPAVQRYRFAQGAIAWLLPDRAVLWTAAPRFLEDEVLALYEVGQRAVWDTGLEIVPAARMGRAFAQLWTGTAAALEARGVDRSFSRIAGHNLASIAAQRRLGARPAGQGLFVRWGSWQLSILSRPPYVRGTVRGRPVRLRFP